MGSALKVMLRAPIFYPRCNIKSLGGLGGGQETDEISNCGVISH